MPPGTHAKIGSTPNPIPALRFTTLQYITLHWMASTKGCKPLIIVMVGADFKVTVIASIHIISLLQCIIDHSTINTLLLVA